jgi:RES domain-containing protein
VSVQVWRIVQRALTASAFTGEGARLHGGRWNHPGTAVVYAAESRALAVLEMLVHLQDWKHLCTRYVCIPVSFPEALVEQLNKPLPKSWRQYPASNLTKDIGNEWARAQRSPVLQVPSAVLPQERNFLLNPLHPEYVQVVVGKAETLELDRRLARR